MRVAVVAEETAHHRDPSDAARRLSRLAAGLTDRGHEVTVFCAQWWEGSPVTFEHEGVTYRAITTAPAPREAATPWQCLWRLPRLLGRFEPDVIHAGHRNPYAVHGARWARFRQGAPLVVEWYDTDPATGWRERARKRAAGTPGLVVTPSRLVQTAVRELGRPEDATAVIPTPVDMAAIRETTPEPVADIVYSRRLDGDANLESLLLALAELRDVDWTTVVIGDGPERTVYERQAEDLRIDDKVRFVGDLEPGERLAVFRGAHVYAQTALRTPFAIDLLRALACGCVGIAEYHVESSAHELVEHRDRGILTTSDDELVEALRAAADLPRQDINERFEEYDESRILDRYLDRYEDLA